MGSKMKVSEIVVQVMAAIVFACLYIQTAFVVAWPSNNLANFRSNETVLEAPMSTLEVSLLGGLSNLGGLLAMPLSNWTYSTIGRKYGTVVMSLPFVISWLIKSLTKSIPLILTAVTLAGAGISGQFISNVYISEIAHISIRGAMVSGSSIGFLVGLLLSYTMGGYVQYSTAVMIQLTSAVLTTVLCALLPESPVFLVMVGKEKEAAKSLSFYRRRDVRSKEIEDEIEQIKRTLNPKLDHLYQETGQVTDAEATEGMLETSNTDKDKKTMSAWQFLMQSKSSKRILVTVLIISAGVFLMGGSVLQVYAEPLFAEAVPAMSANQCAIFIAVDFLIGSSVCVVVIDKYGRRPTFITTAAIAGVSMGLLGIQLQLQLAPHWCTAALIYLYGFVYTVGCSVMPFVLSAEVFLPEVRSICSSFCYAFIWIFDFMTLFTFNHIVELFGLYAAFYAFSIMCIAGATYAYIYLAETNGVPVDVIQARFLKLPAYRRNGEIKE